MPVMNLTEVTLRNLKKPESGYVIYSDKNLAGFGVRVTSNGHTSYVLTYGEKRRRVTIGDVGIIKLAKARAKAKDILSEFQLNGDRPKSMTWNEAKDLYVARHVEKNTRPITQIGTKRLLKRFDALKDKRLSDLVPNDLISIVDKLADRPGSANHHFVCVKGFLNWCVSHHYLDRNPLFGLKKPHRTRARERVLDESELRAILKAIPERGKYGEIVSWCLYTLQRRSQIAQLRGEFFDGHTIKWPAECMKANRVHEIPYSTNQIPSQGLLFPNAKGRPWNAWSKPHQQFLQASQTENWTLHDLRRTGATIMCDKLKIPPHVVERILAHASGTISPLALIYNRAGYMDEMKHALDVYRAYLGKLASLGQSST